MMIWIPDLQHQSNSLYDAWVLSGFATDSLGDNCWNWSWVYISSKCTMDVIVKVGMGLEVWDGGWDGTVADDLCPH